MRKLFYENFILAEELISYVSIKSYEAIPFVGMYLGTVVDDNIIVHVFVSVANEVENKIYFMQGLNGFSQKLMDVNIGSVCQILYMGTYEEEVDEDTYHEVDIHILDAVKFC